MKQILFFLVLFFITGNLFSQKIKLKSDVFYNGDTAVARIDKLDRNRYVVFSPKNDTLIDIVIKEVTGNRFAVMDFRTFKIKVDADLKMVNFTLKEKKIITDNLLEEEIFGPNGLDKDAVISFTNQYAQDLTEKYSKIAAKKADELKDEQAIVKRVNPKAAGDGTITNGKGEVIAVIGVTVTDKVVTKVEIRTPGGFSLIATNAAHLNLSFLRFETAKDSKVHSFDNIDPYFKIGSKTAEDRKEVFQQIANYFVSKEYF
jgi:hypothetical protein